MMRDTTRPLPFLAAARGVFGLTLEGMVWSRRSLLIALLLGFPFVFAILYRTVLAAHVGPEMTPFELYGFLVAVYSVRNVVPLAALFYATALIADEVEGKTLTYLLTRPIGREAILAGKYAAYLATTLAFALPATVLAFFLLATAPGGGGVAASVSDLFRDLGVVALALATYGALFTLLGVLLRRPLIPGLVFLFGWELLANTPGYLPRLTVTTWLRSLLRHRPAQEGFGELFAQVQPAGLSLAVLAGMVVLFLGLAFWIFSSREYVMEQ